MFGRELFDGQKNYDNEYYDEDLDLLNSFRNIPDEENDDNSMFEEAKENTDDNELSIDDLDEDFDDDDDDDGF